MTESAESLEKMLSSIPTAAVTFLIHVGIALLAYFICSKIINWLSRLIAKRLTEKQSFQKSAITFITSLVSVLLKVFVAVTLLMQLGLKEATVLAALGSVGVGLGLALQGGMANLAGGILILFVKPFTVGDYIVETAEGNEGTVHSIDIFYTTLYTFDNKKIVIPNKKLTDSSVINLTAKGERILEIKICISYESDLKKAKEVLKEICVADPEVMLKDDVHVFVDELSNDAVHLGVRAWVKTEDYWKAKWRMQENMKLRLENEGIVIPYKQLDVHIKETGREVE